MNEYHTTSDVPQDRLTRICDSAGEHIHDHPELREGDRAIIMMFGDDPDSDGLRGGIGIFGYDGDEAAAVVDILIHLRAIMRAQGRDIEIIGMPDSPEGIDDGGG